MLATTFPLFLVAFGGSVSAQILARLVDQTISERASRPAGGLALTPEKSCSNDLLSCNSGSFCCPTSLTCTNLVGFVATCCPADPDDIQSVGCRNPLMTAPYCADDTWNLWDASRGGIAQSGYFCCAPGLVGLMTEQCIDPATLASPTLEAMQMEPGGAPMTTSSTAVVGTVTGTAAKTVATTSVSASTATTVVAFGNSTVTKSSSTKSPSSLSSLTSAGASTAVTTPSSSAAQPSTSKTSDGNTFKTFGFESSMLLQGVLALFVGVAL